MYNTVYLYNLCSCCLQVDICMLNIPYTMQTISQIKYTQIKLTLSEIFQLKVFEKFNAFLIIIKYE